jgi:hypothetical protein
VLDLNATIDNIIDLDVLQGLNETLNLNTSVTLPLIESLNTLGYILEPSGITFISYVLTSLPIKVTGEELSNIINIFMT